MQRATFSLQPIGPFSLGSAAAFARGFSPCASSLVAVDDGLRASFCADKSFATVHVVLQQRESDVLCTMTSDANVDVDAVAQQVARMFSLDGDGRGYAALGRRDPVVGMLLEQLDGLRPVCFPSPYEAAAWGILAARTSMRQAAGVKARLSAETGAFVSPARLLQVHTFPGVSPEKLRRLHGIAEAALDGMLDAERLRGLPREQALRELRTLRGVGEWTAAHILLRGAATIDEPAFGEPRVRRGFALAHSLARDPSEAELVAHAETWRPYRTWVCVLLAAFLARSGDWAEPSGHRAHPRRSARRAHATP